MAERLYEKYYAGDRERRGLFVAIAKRYQPKRVLYPGGFIHVAASFEFPSVVYVDNDRQARRFFAKPEQVSALVTNRKTYDEAAEIQFFGQSYESPLDLPDNSFDLLISLYAGFISAPCRRYLKVGGLLVVNNSHADAGLASIDANYALVGVVVGRGDRLRVAEDNLDQYLIPKKSEPVTELLLRTRGRGIAYTKAATAYVFERVK